MLRFNKNIKIIIGILVLLSILNIYRNNNVKHLCPDLKCTTGGDSNYNQEKFNNVSS